MNFHAPKKKILNINKIKFNEPIKMKKSRVLVCILKY